MADAKQVLINLVSSLGLADHMGDVYEDCEKALRLIGINPPEWEEGSDLMKFLEENHHAASLWTMEDLR